MPDGSVLELNSLPDRHPRVALLEAVATSTIVRLSLDPTALPDGTMSRAVSVDWMARPGGGPVVAVARQIGWGGVPAHVADACVLWPLTKNANDITEEAAIGVMALLLHDLERAEIRSVLQIGSGGDFVVAIDGQPPTQAECSGVREDPTGSLSADRLRRKCEQVLTKSSAGFAAITAFRHGPGHGVHSHLRFVTAPRPRTRKPRRKK